MSKALLPLGSTGELSGLRSFQEPIMSRTRGLLGRDGLRTKSKVKADPKESERKPRDLPNFCAILLLSVAIQDTQLCPAGRGRTPVCVRRLLLREVFGWSIHQLPLLCVVVAGVKHTPPVLTSSPRSQIRHGVPESERDSISKLFFALDITSPSSRQTL